MKCESYFLFEKIIWEMKAFRIKQIHSKFKSLRQFTFLKKIKNFHFEGYFHLSERGSVMKQGLIVEEVPYT